MGVFEICMSYSSGSRMNIKVSTLGKRMKHKMQYTDQLWVLETSLKRCYCGFKLQCKQTGQILVLHCQKRQKRNLFLLGENDSAPTMDYLLPVCHPFAFLQLIERLAVWLVRLRDGNGKQSRFSLVAASPAFLWLIIRNTKHIPVRIAEQVSRPGVGMLFLQL